MATEHSSVMVADHGPGVPVPGDDPGDAAWAWSMALAERLAGTGGLPLAAIGPDRAPGGLAAALACWRRLGLPVVQERDGLYWRPAPGLALDRARVGAGLAAAGQHCPFAIVPLTDSTNARLLAAAVAGDSAPRLLLAEVQSAGRGRRQRSWQVRYGEGILLSVLLRPNRPPAQWPGLALATGVALAECLQQAGVADIGLKWPNDLVRAGGKLGGVLVEAASGGASAAVVVGLGLNWALGPDTRAGLDQAAADLSGALPPQAGARSELAGRLAGRVLAMAAQFEAEGLAPFLPRFERFDVLRDRPVLVHVDHGPARPGLARGLAADGALRVEHDGRVCTWHSADVTIRPA
jgi:BirA family biotin operon repressor/biotin-[acetyl-CoA-carboxylase] ligase